MNILLHFVYCRGIDTHSKGKLPVVCMSDSIVHVCMFGPAVVSELTDKMVNNANGKGKELLLTVVLVLHNKYRIYIASTINPAVQMCM